MDLFMSYRYMATFHNNVIHGRNGYFYLNNIMIIFKRSTTFSKTYLVN
jgi:hypothetical protein